MMSPNPSPDDRGPSHAANFRHTPLQIIHFIGNFLRIWSVYSMYSYLSQTGASVVLFIFSCLVPSSILFLIMQKPWKGRPLSNTQVVPSLINGGITALYYILWGIGLKSCGPVRAILAEYSGAVLGVLSAVLYGRKGHVWKKVGGLFAMLASFYFLSQGWATATHSPFSFTNSNEDDSEGNKTQEILNMKSMVAPIFAVILSALRSVITRRISLKNQLKRRLHAITIASATCSLFLVALWDMIVVLDKKSKVTYDQLTTNMCPVLSIHRIHKILIKCFGISIWYYHYHCRDSIHGQNQAPFTKYFPNDVNVKFRNYLPHAKQLQEGKLAPPQLPKFEDRVATEPPIEEEKQ